MKRDLWLCIGFSIAGVLNLIVFAILSSLKIVPMSNLSYVFAIGYIAAIWVPFILRLLFKLDFNIIVFISYQIFILLSIVVGSLWRVYDLGIYFDKILHFSSGILFALIAYDLFRNNRKNQITLFWLFVLVFSFSLMCGAVWEIYEFSTDGIFGNNAQGWLGNVGRDALNDTMYDIICDFVGAIIGGVICILLERKNRKDGQIEEIKNVQEDDNRKQ